MDQPRTQMAGHRTMPHTADLRVDAWAGSRERCIAEAVLGTVESFLDVSAAHPTGTHHFQLTASSDVDLLVAVLEEVVYLMETSGEVPVDVELVPLDATVGVRFATIGAEALPQVGAVPTAVSLHELTLAASPGGWFCSVTLDV
ncbi:SHS2 domain-containing protein [Kribbella orskensis]|uniref:SHS2 domain-containing protein n=1 Tax=Kribbella orskensis TaxID=2512216 RepID=A0ABY2B948_9ACTN|nr:MULTISPECIES: archease [Kribbella]TCN31181.1 SHS2 domain-containing protein [Kribbella sp. VKM Ac-2500]TCO11687.1 SHS2 domain-containing protein [Kribbella orskensis]